MPVLKDRTARTKRMAVSATPGARLESSEVFEVGIATS